MPTKLIVKPLLRSLAAAGTGLTTHHAATIILAEGDCRPDNAIINKLSVRRATRSEVIPINKLVASLTPVFLIVAGCASQEPTIQTGPNAETTFDGLVRIDNARFAAAWVDPEIDFTQYTKIIPGGAEFEFRAARKVSASAARNTNRREFWISDANRQRLTEMVSEVFTEELQRSEHFTLVEEPGPDTLIIHGALHDIVSRVPPQDVGRSEVWLRTIGEATLIIELRDSLSNEVIYRAVERRAIENMGQQMTQAHTATTWAEVRRWARRWAVRLREGLDSVHQ